MNTRAVHLVTQTVIPRIRKVDQTGGPIARVENSRHSCLVWPAALLLYKAITRVRVVVDTVLLFQFLNVVESSLGMRTSDPVAERLVRM